MVSCTTYKLQYKYCDFVFDVKHLLGTGFTVGGCGFFVVGGGGGFVTGCLSSVKNSTLMQLL